MRILNQISKKITNWLMKQQVIERSQEEFYQYGFKLLVSSLFDAFLVLFLGILLDCTPLAVSYVLILMTVRTQIGGFHANTYFGCCVCYMIFFITSLVLYVGCIWYQFSVLMLVLAILTNIVFELIWAPVLHTRKLTGTERIQAKNAGLRRTAIWSLFAILVWNIDNKWSYAVVVVLCVSIMLMTFELICQKRRRYVNGNIKR